MRLRKKWWGEEKTRFEKIKKELTIEQLAEYLEDFSDGYCYEMCQKKTGNKYKCPYEDNPDCRGCIFEWLNMEVNDGE